MSAVMRIVLPMVTLACLPVHAQECAHARIEREVAAADRENAILQARLAKRCSLLDYANLVQDRDGTNVWTAAFQKAIDENEIVVVPSRAEPYFLDGTLRIRSNRRIEAKGATVRLVNGVRTVMLRNEGTKDGAREPIPFGARDLNIAVVGGRWEDCCTRRAGYGSSGVYDVGVRGFGNFLGVSTLFLFNNCDHVSLRGVTFVRCGGFAVQAGMGEAYLFDDITFDSCFADGLHLNGGLVRVHARAVRGTVGDDLVAINAYDWLNSSVTFAPMRFILCEDMKLLGGYPAIRILPGTYRFPDGKKVDCSISDLILRRISGIRTYKMYLQPPAYEIGGTPEWGEIGTGGNIFFEQLSIDLDKPSDTFDVYMKSDPVRGHFGVFEIGANLSSVVFRDLDVTFHADKLPLSHLVAVGPKSVNVTSGNKTYECFAPYLSCTVGEVCCENVRLHGVLPSELVHETRFDNVNGDGHSSGQGCVKRVRHL